MGLEAAAISLGDRMESLRAAAEAALTPWLPQFLRAPGSSVEGWSEYAPLEFFLGLVLIIGVILLCSGFVGLVHALSLRLTALRLEALAADREIAAAEYLKQSFLRAFRASRRLRHAAQNYVDLLKVVPSADGDRLAAALPAREFLSVEALASSLSRMRSERLLGTIIGLGGIVIVIELGVGVLRFRAQFAEAATTQGIDALLDPALSGAVFALGCVALTAIAVGLHRIILRLVHANLARMQAAVDALFFRPAGIIAAGGPRLAWSVRTAPSAALAVEPPPLTTAAPAAEDAPVLTLDLAVDLDRSAAAPETGEPMKSTVETESEGLAAAHFERTTAEIRLLVAALGEEVSSQRDTLGEILTRMSDPIPADDRPSELAQLRESTAELALLADATRESITQLAQITESLSRIVTSLVTHANDAAGASWTPGAAAPGVLSELRELLREVEEAELISSQAEDGFGTDETLRVPESQRRVDG